VCSRGPFAPFYGSSSRRPRRSPFPRSRRRAGPAARVRWIRAV